jgi:hypothetical protein
MAHTPAGAPNIENMGLAGVHDGLDCIGHVAKYATACNIPLKAAVDRREDPALGTIHLPVTGQDVKITSHEACVSNEELTHGIAFIQCCKGLPVRPNYGRGCPSASGDGEV